MPIDFSDITQPLGGSQVSAMPQSTRGALDFSDVVTSLPSREKQIIEEPDEEEDKPSWLKKAFDFVTRSEQKFADTLGTALAVATGVDEQINRARIEEAEAKQKLLASIKTASPESKQRILAMLRDGTYVPSVEEVLPSINKTSGQIFGEAGGVFMDILTAGEASALKGLTTAQKIKRGAALGGGYGATEAAQEKKDIIPSTITGAAIGITAELGIPLVLHSAGYLGGKAKEGVKKVITSATERVRPFAQSAAEHLEPVIKVGRRMITSIDSNLRKYGDEGTQIASKLETAQKDAYRKASNDITTMYEQINRLNPVELENFTDAAEGLVAPVSENVGRAVQAWKSIASNIADEAQKNKLEIRLNTGEKIPFAPRENFVPHYIPQEEMAALLRSKDKQSQLFSTMVAQGKAENVAEAKQIFDDYVSKRLTGRYGHLERGREIDFPIYEKDPRKFLYDYILKSWERIKHAEEFGPDNEIVNDLITKAKEKGSDWEEIQRLFRRASGDDFFDPRLVDVSQKVRSFELLTKLGLSAITNTGQIVNTIVRTGMWPTLKAQFSDVLRQENRLWAQRAGNIEALIKKQAELAGAGGNVAEKFLKFVGFEATELNNRNVAANAGKNYAESLFNSLQKRGSDDPSREFIVRRLTDLGIDVDDALRVGRISDEDLLNAGYTVIKDTQFFVDPKDLPYYWSAPGGKILTQFKSFAFKQAKFVKKQIYDEFTQGNYKPLIVYLATAAGLGEVVGDVKALVRGRGRPEGIERVMDNLLTIGGVGLASDFISSMRYGSVGSGFLGFIAGPFLSDTNRLINGIGDAAFRGSFKGLAKTVLSNVPVVGQPLRETVFPSKQKYKARIIPLEEEISNALGL